MKRTLLLLGILLMTAAPAMADSSMRVPGMSQDSLCSHHMSVGDRYRANERYELARQNYAQALSVCSGKRVADARKALDSMEFLLRTMR